MVLETIVKVYGCGWEERPGFFTNRNWQGLLSSRNVFWPKDMLWESSRIIGPHAFVADMSEIHLSVPLIIARIYQLHSVLTACFYIFTNSQS